VTQDNGGIHRRVIDRFLRRLFAPPTPHRRRHSHAAFLFTNSASFRHQTADIVRHNPAVSAGGKLARGQEKSQ